MKSRIVMFLMNEKGYLVLENFISKYGIDPIDVVIISRDPNVQKDYYIEIKNLCLENGIKVMDKSEKIDFLAKNSIGFAIGWRWIINNVDQLIVFHDSLLPRYRGFAPLVNSLINKEKVVGVTALFASSEFDKGDIIAQKSIEVRYPIKIEEAIKKISTLYISLVNSIIEGMIDGEKLEGIPQNEVEASYSLWRDEEDYLIDWDMDAEYIERFIHSTGFPYKGASAFHSGKKVRITDASIFPDVLIENRSAGKVLFFEEDKPIVVCGRGLLKIENMVDDETGTNVLPLNKFRVRFE